MMYACGNVDDASVWNVSPLKLRKSFVSELLSWDKTTYERQSRLSSLLKQSIIPNENELHAPQE